MNGPKDTLNQRIQDEMTDSLDEELERELDDNRLDHLVNEISRNGIKTDIDHHVYFRELFRLQGDMSWSNFRTGCSTRSLK